MASDTALPSSTKAMPAEAAAPVVVRAVGHTFDNGFRALDPTTLEVEAGTFCTLLGPSGSGKTTLLRILAGLLRPTEGRVLIGGRDVTEEPIQKRDIGFVFQHYALFPHMTVAQNIAYPLRIRRMSRRERDEKVAATLELIGLDHLSDRRPDQLSGGQQQRVAIGRALVYGPKVLLLDEPLGALDRRLRQSLGAELRRIQQETGTTAIYVTHDQEEAFLLSDHVVVMDHGRVKQKGSPESVYGLPTDVFVANFLGDTNMIKGIARETSDGPALEVAGQTILCQPGSTAVPDSEAALSVRPEEVRVAPSAEQLDGFCFGTGTVVDRVFMGAHYRTKVLVGEQVIVAEAARDDFHPAPGANIAVGWDQARPVLISTTTEAP